MADLKNRFVNFDGESVGHQQWPADILAEELQPTKDVYVPPDNTEIETIARANIAVGGNAEPTHTFRNRLSRAPFTNSQRMPVDDSPDRGGRNHNGDVSHRGRNSGSGRPCRETKADNTRPN
jgi:hypothetical protein